MNWSRFPQPVAITARTSHLRRKILFPYASEQSSHPQQQSHAQRDRYSDAQYHQRDAEYDAYRRTQVAKDHGGTRVPLDVKAGDVILFGKYGGQEIKLDGEEHLIMREDEVLAVIETG